MAMLSFKRKVLILAVCIAVLAGTYVLGLVFSPARTGKREAASALVPGFNRQLRDTVAEIRLNSDRGSRVLRKKGDTWILPEGDREYPASTDRIDALLDFIADLTRTRIVTANPDSWEEFEVNKETPKRIRLLDSSESELVEILVGKSAVGGQENYVRLGGSNEIFLSNRSFDYYLNVDQSFWAYLRIFPDDLEGQSIMRISVDGTLSSGEEGLVPLRYTLVLSSEQPPVWKLVDHSELELDNSKVDLLASNLASLEGSGFARGVGPQETGLTDPTAQILVSTQDNRDFRLVVGSKVGDDQYYAALDNGSYIYTVSEWRLQGVLKSLEDLQPAEE